MFFIRYFFAALIDGMIYVKLYTRGTTLVRPVCFTLSIRQPKELLYVEFVVKRLELEQVFL